MLRALALYAGLAIALAIAWQMRLSGKQQPRYSDKFVEVQPGIQRLGYTWKNFGGLLNVDVLVYLIKHGSDYLLVDVSAPGAERVLPHAVQEATKDGKLRLVLRKSSLHQRSVYLSLSVLAPRAHAQEDEMKEPDEFLMLFREKTATFICSDCLVLDS
jgi:hypothetical protein